MILKINQSNLLNQIKDLNENIKLKKSLIKQLKKNISEYPQLEEDSKLRAKSSASSKKEEKFEKIELKHPNKCKSVDQLKEKHIDKEKVLNKNKKKPPIHKSKIILIKNIKAQSLNNQDKLLDELNNL